MFDSSLVHHYPSSIRKRAFRLYLGLSAISSASSTSIPVQLECETGVGVQNGEGVYGLRRALVLAGAQTQLASLWKVADTVTKDLMWITTSACSKEKAARGRCALHKRR